MGNLVIDGIRGEPFASEKADMIRDQAHQFLGEMNQKLFYDVFGFRERALNHETVFTGSFGYYLKNPQPGKIIGDLDIILPIHCKPRVEFYLAEKNIKFKKIANQLLTLLEFGRKTYQADLQFKPYVDNEPTEFAQFSNSWHAGDAAIGLKGAFHKILLGSLTAAWAGQDAFSTSLGVRPKYAGGIPITDMEGIFIRLFFGRHTNSEAENIERKVYSAFSEMRFYNFRGVLELMVSIFHPHETRIVLERFREKILDSKYAFPQDQLDIVSKLILQITGMMLDFKKCEKLESPSGDSIH